MTWPDWMAGCYAHRGLHGPGIPENTIAAFEAAIAGGYGIELDVGLCAGDEAVVFHDSTLKRLANLDKALSALSADELAQVHILGGAQTIQRLSTVLDVIADRAPVLIELKSSTAFPHRLEAAVGRVVSEYRGRAAVMSWNVLSMIWMRRYYPTIPRGLVVTAFRRGFSFSSNPFLLVMALMPVHWTDAAFLAHDIRHLPSRRSKRFRQKGKPVVTWTVRTEDQLARARAHADAPVFEGDIERLLQRPAAPL